MTEIARSGLGRYEQLPARQRAATDTSVPAAARSRPNEKEMTMVVYDALIGFVLEVAKFVADGLWPVVPVI